MKLRSFLTILVCLIATHLFAQPGWRSFTTNQFSTNGLSLKIKSGALFTNVQLRGVTSVVTQNVGTIFITNNPFMLNTNPSFVGIISGNVGLATNSTGVAIDDLAGGAALFDGTYNVTHPDYGAVGDGVTVDTVAIQKALNAAGTNGGGIVLMPPGIYMANTLTQWGNVELRGVGEAPSILRSTGAGTLLRVQGNATNFSTHLRIGPRISNLTFDGNHVGTIGCRLTDLSAFQVHGVNFQRFTDAGLNAYGVNVGVVGSSRFFSNNVGYRLEAAVVPGYGSSLPPSLMTVRDSFFYNNTNRAIDYSGGTGLFIDGSNFEINGMGDVTAVTIRVAPDSAWGTYGLVMNNCWLEGNSGAAYVDLVNVAGPIQHSISDTFFNNYITTVPIKLGGGGAGKNTLVVENLLSWDNFGLTENQSIVISGTNSSFRSINSSFDYVGTPASHHRYTEGGIVMQNVDEYKPYIIMDSTGQGQSKGKFTWYVGPDNSFNIARYINTNYFEEQGLTVLQLLGDTGEIVAAGTNKFVGNGSGLTNLTGVSGLSNVTDSGYTALVRSNLVVDGTVSAVAATTSVAAFNATSPITGGLLDYAWALNAMAPNIVSNSGMMLLFGKAESTNNSAHLAYVHSADGSTANRFSLGLFGSDNIFNVFASGGASLGSTTDPGAGNLVANAFLGNSARITNGGANTLGLTVGGTALVVTNGNVGIGTTTPIATVDIVTTNPTPFRVTIDTNILMDFGTDDLLTGGLPAMRVYHAGTNLVSNYLWLMDIGDDSGTLPAPQAAISVGLARRGYAGAFVGNLVWDQQNTQWRVQDTNYVATMFETGQEGASLHATPIGTSDWGLLTGDQFLARLAPNGNFGLGSSLVFGAPTARLHVLADNLVAALLKVGTTNKPNILFVNTNGNVGIGTTNPNVIGYSIDNVVLDIRGTAAKLGVAMLGTVGTFGGASDSMGALNFYTLNGGSSVVGRSLILSALDGATNSTFMSMWTMNDGSLAERLRIDHSGNVGIGTANPLTKLHVVMAVPAGAAAPVDAYESLTLDGSAASYINIRTAVTGNGGFLFSDDARAAGAVIYNHNLDTLAFLGQGAGAVMGTFDSSGDFGIGTAAPQNKLDVSGAVAIGSYAGVDTAPVNGMIVSGNVGIGTNAPAAKLHVLGDAIITGAQTNTALAGSGYRFLQVDDGGKFSAVMATNLSVGGNFSTNASGDALFVGAVTIGGGTPMVRVLSASAALNFPDTAAGISSDLTITVPGAENADVVALGVGSDGTSTVSTNGLFFYWVSSNDTVTVRFINNSILSSYNPPSATFRAMVTKF